MTANNAAGMIGKFGQANFMSVSSMVTNSDQMQKSSTSKFFKSRNHNVQNQVINEEATDDDDNENVDPNINGGKIGSAEIYCDKTTEEVIDDSNINEDVSTTPMKAQENITVVVRVRPGDVENNGVEVLDNQVVVDGDGAKVYAYSKVLDQSCSQEAVFKSVAENQVEKFLQGYNGTIMVYGQTGAGKTYTMGTSGLGQKEICLSRGVIPRVIETVFKHISAMSCSEVTVKISFFEILKEQVYDLLNPTKKKVPLSVRDNSVVFKVAHLTDVEVDSVSSAVDVLARGSRLRATAATSLNADSSRSHAIFQLQLTTVNQSSGKTISRMMNLVDLAGSESVKRTGAVGELREEGNAINKGLLDLNMVIKALSKEETHVPYRNGTLTKVLKESLSSKCYVTLIACINPNLANKLETVNTLKFAYEAKRIKIQPVPAHLITTAPGISGFNTPAANKTIHTTTPSKLNTGSKRNLNATIGTPGKRQRIEPKSGKSTFATPMVGNRTKSRIVSSTSTKLVTNAPSFTPSDVDLSGISMIEPPSDDSQEAEATTSNGMSFLPSQTISVADLASVLAPIMKNMQEELSSTMTQEMGKFMSTLAVGSVKKSAMTPKKPAMTPVKKAKSRMTSSPNRELARLALEESSEAEEISTNATVLEKPTAAEDDDVISGIGLPMSVVSHPRVSDIQKSVAIPSYDSPPSSSKKGSANSPTIEEMERSLGINPDSPGEILFSKPVAPSKAPLKPRRTTRRTTMMEGELNATLREIRNVSMMRNDSPKDRRRSVRVAAQGKFYGSPSNMPVEGGFRHPLQTNENWKVLNVQKHRTNLLNILNSGNMKILQALPAIGAKSAIEIQQHRELNGEFSAIEDLKSVLGETVWKKFAVKNQIS